MNDYLNEPGNYYIAPGTWVRHRNHWGHETGVVAALPDIHESGSVKILWYPNSIETMSARMFREKLRTRSIVIDSGQHPYDKVDWEVGDER